MTGFKDVYPSRQFTDYDSLTRYQKSLSQKRVTGEDSEFAFGSFFFTYKFFPETQKICQIQKVQKYKMFLIYIAFNMYTLRFGFR